jgi:RNA polymerase sigma-70 factor (ECF subfamily)
LEVDIIERMMGSTDSDRLAGWYDAYSDALVLYARHWLGPDAAQDAVQGAFMKLMAQTLTPSGVKAWLFRTVRNEAITRIRREQCRRRHDRELSARRTPWFESRPDDLIDGQKAQEVLMALPEAQREVVLLRIWGQLSLKQTAQVVGSSLTTVHSRYKAALAAIKERMQQSCKTKPD